MPLSKAIEQWARETGAKLQSLRREHDRRQPEHQALSEQLERFVAASGEALAEVLSISAGTMIPRSLGTGSLLPRGTVLGV
jgi:DUF1365 family protein